MKSEYLMFHLSKACICNLFAQPLSTSGTTLHMYASQPKGCYGHDITQLLTFQIDVVGVELLLCRQ